jgi:hypothetical protein
MTDALAECGNGKAPGTELNKCAPFAPSFDLDASRNCRLETQIPDESVSTLPTQTVLNGAKGCRILQAIEGSTRMQHPLDR